MIKYNGGLLVCLMMGSNAFCMEDLHNVRYEQLKAQWDAVIKQQAEFDNEHGDAWRTDSALQQERDRLQDQHRILMNAVMNSDIPQELLKPHGITHADKATESSNDKKRPQSFNEIFQSSVVKKGVQKREAMPQVVPLAVTQMSSKQIAKQILNSYDDLWQMLCAEAQGKKGSELAAIADQLDAVEDQKTLVWKTFIKK
jgi:hypothetical protein